MCRESKYFFSFVGLCLIKVDVLNMLGSVKHVCLVKYMSMGVYVNAHGVSKGVRKRESEDEMDSGGLVLYKSDQS